MKIRNYEGKTEQVKGILYAIKAMNGRKVNIGKQFGIGHVYRASIINSGLFEIKRGKISWNRHNIPITDELVSEIVNEAKEINKVKNMALRERLNSKSKPVEHYQLEIDAALGEQENKIESRIELLESKLEQILAKQDRILSGIETLTKRGNQSWIPSMINA